MPSRKNQRINLETSYASLPGSFWSAASPSTFPSPSIVKLNLGLCEELGISPSWLQSEEGTSMLVGSAVPAGARPVAMAYAGHQFGHWNPQLGDGRAVLLGEVQDGRGVLRDLHLKGSGATVFSRSGDGRATLGSVLREYLLSEAMHALGVPTTRSLAVTTTGEEVFRAGPVPGAVLARVAHSHVRVGTFQYFSNRGEEESVRQLADYMLERHFPEVRSAANPYVAMLSEVAKRHANLVAQWMQLGFIHGVMNTDNSQIVGETIDYGPCAFMDEFHPQCVFSSIDRQGRYAWANQPVMAQWNLERFAETLLPLLDSEAERAVMRATEALSGFSTQFDRAFIAGFMRKLGLQAGREASDVLEAQVRQEDRAFVGSTLQVLAEQHVDFTLFFRNLGALAAGESPASVVSLFDSQAAAENWLDTWAKHFAAASCSALQGDRIEAMARANPVYIPRNHRVEEVIAHAHEGDFEPFYRLLDVLAKPFESRSEYRAYEAAPTSSEKVLETFCGT